MYPTSTMRMRIQANRCSCFIVSSRCRNASATSGGQSPRESEEQAHAFMPEVDALAVHHRAGTSDDADIVLAAVLHRFRRHARSLRGGLMHPNAANTGIAALAHDLLGRLRARDDHHRVNAARDRSQVRIAAITLEPLHVRVHREYIVSARLQPPID